MQYSDQQKNLQTYLNNIPYISKAAMSDHIARFIRENEYFWVRSNVEKTTNNQFFCFIELVGYVHIGKNMIQIRIMFPHNYPAAPPQFDLVYNSSAFIVVNQGALVTAQTIYIRKNDAQEELIRLNFESIKRVWTQSRHICQALKEVCKDINNPLLLVPVAYEAPSSKSFIDFKIGRQKSSDMTEKVIQDIQLEICVLQEKQSKVQAAKREMDYREARADFILRNAGKLEKSIKTQENKINKQLDQLRERHEKMIVNNTVDPLLEITELQKNKITAVARREALKEAEKKVTNCIERSLTQTTSYGFEQHKNLIRNLYEEMFQSQLQYLKLCE